MGRTSGKWQQFGFGSLEYIRTGCVAKLGIITEKRGNTAEVLSNLSIVYTSCMLEGGKCARKKKRMKNYTRFKHWTRYAEGVSSTTHI